MGGLHKKISKIHPVAMLDKDLFDELHPMGTAAELQYDQRKAMEEAAKEVEAEETIPVPDEDAVKRDTRKRVALRRKAARASTVLSTSEGFGG